MISRRCLIASAFALLPFAAQAQFGPPELIEAARKEGKLVFYSANVAESETPVINAFNKRFRSSRSSSCARRAISCCSA